MEEMARVAANICSIEAGFTSKSHGVYDADGKVGILGGTAVSSGADGKSRRWAPARASAGATAWGPVKRMRLS